jgi:predicted transcriptional regulator
MSSQEAEHSSSERIDITAPTHVLHYMDDIAMNHFQGNRSQMIRSAVYFYGKFLEQGTTLELEKIERELEQSSRQLTKLTTIIDNMTDDMEQVTAHLDPVELITEQQDQTYADAREILKVVNQSSDGVLSEDGVIEQTDIRPRRVKSGLETLLDLGFLEINRQRGERKYKTIRQL